MDPTLLAVGAAVLAAIAAIIVDAAISHRNLVASAAVAWGTAFRGAYAARSVAILVAFGSAFTAFYLVALPAERFGALSFAALQFLTVGDACAAALIGYGAGLTFALNATARRSKATQTTLTFSGVVAALLPSSLCCTSVIPSLLATLGASAPAVLHLTGRFQGFFATYASAFIGVAVFAVLISLWLAIVNLTGYCSTNLPLTEESQ